MERKEGKTRVGQEGKGEEETDIGRLENIWKRKREDEKN